MKSVRLLSLLLLVLSACSNQAIYRGLQEREKNLCALGPVSGYEACMKRAEMSFGEYGKQDFPPGRNPF